MDYKFVTVCDNELLFEKFVSNCMRNEYTAGD